ncbi:MAG: hypothetical protein AMXMBFR64_46720 [Myxococcales bacterium]
MTSAQQYPRLQPMSGAERPPQGQGTKVAVLYNTDYATLDIVEEDAEPPSHAADAGVAETAQAVAASLAVAGWDPVLLTVSDAIDDLPERLRDAGIGVVFNLVESLGGDPHREPDVPAALEAANIAYTGNGPAALALAHAKDAARERLRSRGVPVPRGFAIHDPDRIINLPWGGLDFPLFVKPARTDASIGVEQSSVVRDVGELRRQLERLAARVPGPYLVEEYLPGRELNVAIFPDPFRGRYVPTEIDFSALPAGCAPIVTYDCKWTPGTPDYQAESRPCGDALGPVLLRAVVRTSRAAFLALGATSYGRVDLRLDAAGRPRVIDVNPNPDIHPDAGACLAAASVGIDHPTFVADIAAQASAPGAARGWSWPSRNRKAADRRGSSPRRIFVPALADDPTGGAHEALASIIADPA